MGKSYKTLDNVQKSSCDDVQMYDRVPLIWSKEFVFDLFKVPYFEKIRIGENGG